MADVFSPKKRSEVMSKIKSKDTGPEMRLRRALHRLGYRYKLHDKKLPGKPDLVFSKYKTVIQVRGCFWHGHEECIDGHIPKTRQDYWVPKLEKNKLRDEKNDRLLKEMKWDVLVVWECNCMKEDSLSKEVNRIIKHLNSQRKVPE